MLGATTCALERLRRTRGTSRRTQRRMARTAALMLAATGLLTAQSAAATCVVHFVPETSPLPPIVGGSACIGLLPVAGREEPEGFIGAADGNIYDLGGAANGAGLSDVGSFATPTFGDLDGDRDLDALVGNGAGELVFFRNTSNGVLPAFAASALNPFGLQQVDGRSRPALVDIDGDGDLDAFVGDAAGDVVFFGNGGPPTAPAFVKMGADPFGLQNVGQVASPAFADVDLDGDYDAVVGNQNGDTVFFENTGSRTTPQFAAPLVNALGLPKVDAESCPTLGRIDGDGDLDAVIGRADGSFLFAENQFSCPPDFFGPAGGPFGLPNVAAQSDPVFADIDGDGDADAFIGLNHFFDTVVFSENIGTLDDPLFAAPVLDPFGLSAGLEVTSPAFADIDGDGDLDAFIGEAYGTVYQFTNTGDAHAPAFAMPPISNPFGSTGDLAAKPTFGDLDGDGDLDALVGGRNGNFYYFRNTGSTTAPAFATKLTNPFGVIPIGFHSNPTFVDIDVDGDLDIVAGDDSRLTRIFTNTGTRLTPAFVLVAERFGLTDIGTNSAPSFVDIDGDGDPDALFGSIGGSLFLFRNLARAAAPTPEPSATATPTQTIAIITVLPTETDAPTVTASPTPTPPPESTATASASSTATPPPGASPTATASGTPGSAVCVGDCNRDREVVVNELIFGVNVVLGSRDVRDCPAFDPDGDGQVRINDLVLAVTSLLDGCR